MCPARSLDVRCPPRAQRWFPLEGGGAQYGEDYEIDEQDMVEELWDLMGQPWAFRVSYQAQ